MPKFIWRTLVQRIMVVTLVLKRAVMNKEVGGPQKDRLFIDRKSLLVSRFRDQAHYRE
jgi:hypothetical protein